MSKYKQINDKEIEETNTKQRTYKTIHNIEDVQKQRDYHKLEYDKRVEILKAIEKK